MHKFNLYLVAAGPMAGTITGIAQPPVIWAAVVLLLVAVSGVAPHLRDCLNDFWAYRLTNRAMNSSADRNKTLREYGKIGKRRGAPPP